MALDVTYNLNKRSVVVLTRSCINIVFDKILLPFKLKLPLLDVKKESACNTGSYNEKELNAIVFTFHVPTETVEKTPIAASKRSILVLPTARFPVLKYIINDDPRYCVPPICSLKKFVSF